MRSSLLFSLALLSSRAAATEFTFESTCRDDIVIDFGTALPTDRPDTYTVDVPGMGPGDLWVVDASNQLLLWTDAYVIQVDLTDLPDGQQVPTRLPEPLVSGSIWGECAVDRVRPRYPVDIASEVLAEDVADAWLDRFAPDVTPDAALLERQLAPIVDELVDRGCRTDALLPTAVGGVYGNGSVTGFDTDGVLLDGSATRRTFGLTLGDGTRVGTTFGGFSAIRGQQVVAETEGGGFFVGRFRRVRGTRGAFYGFAGTCDGDTDWQTALDDWFSGDLPCAAGAGNPDADLDGVPDACDLCPLGDDEDDTDGDGVPDACDPCPDDVFDDRDADGVCDSLDVCPGGDDTLDTDADAVPDLCDVCPGEDDFLDTDGDGQPDACDPCPDDDPDDTDGDGVCDSADICPGHDDTLDTDGDAYPDACDPCPLDNPDDTDGDGVCDSLDVCALGDDASDADGDGVPDACDLCPLDAAGDSDFDGVCDTSDQCPGGDDRVDHDGDGVPDACDPCPEDATDDTDGDGACDSLDVCPGADDSLDADGDGVPDGCDVCLAGDDHVDTDGDGAADACDPCPVDAQDDTDGDGVCDSLDVCPGADDTQDTDNDGAPDACDLCPDDNPDDSDLDGVCDTFDACDGFDDAIDADGDGVPDLCDPCPDDAPDDTDGDGLCTTDELLLGTDPDVADSDDDGVPDGIEQQRSTDPLNPDTDGDGIVDGVEIYRFDSDPNDPSDRALAPDMVSVAAPGRGLVGASVSVVPDLDGDGFDDLLIGAPSQDVGGADAGRLYLARGSTSDTLDLLAMEGGVGGRVLDGREGGWDIQAEHCLVNPQNSVCALAEPTHPVYLARNWGPAGDGLGYRTASLGDMDGDGVGDFAVSAPWERVDGLYWGGGVYVFSGATAWTTTLDDIRAGVGGRHLHAGRGVSEVGDTRNGRAWSQNGDLGGYGLSGGFDLNGDGLGDLAVFTPNAGDASPESAVNIVLGSTSAPASTNLDTVTNGAGGLRFTVSAAVAKELSPHVLAAGDIDGDGFGDLVLNTDGHADLTGHSGWPPPYTQVAFLLRGGEAMTDLHLDASLDPVRGQVIDQGFTRVVQRIDPVSGFLRPDYPLDAPFTSGRPPAAGGDINGDGLADVVWTGLVPGGRNHGAWVDFGSTTGLSGAPAVHAGSGGFSIDLGANFLVTEPVRTGLQATIVRDMNGDGLDEIALGYETADSAGFTDNGRVYVVWGKTDTTPVTAADLEDGSAGFIIEGPTDHATLGYHLDGGGDLDGDGLGDLVIGAPALTATDASSGGVFVVRGDDFRQAIFRRGTDADDVFDGLASDETLVGGRGDDILRGNGGADVLYGGQGDDRFVIADATFARVHGGTGIDTLAVTGPSWTLDPSVFRGRLFEVERIDLTAPGNHTFSAARQDVLGFDDLSNTVSVLGTPEDAVVLTGGTWTPGASANGFVPWSSGLAVVRVQEGVPVRTGPSFAQDPYRFTTSELAAPGGPVGQVGVLEGGVSGYALSGPQSAAFTVDGAGHITVADPALLDFETDPSLLFQVEATVGGATEVSNVLVTVEDANEPAVWAPLDAMTVSESAQDGTVVGVVTPVPVDPDADDTSTWSIVAGDPDGVFTIHPADGVLSIADARALDFETTPSYTLTLGFTDQGGATSTGSLTVDVSNAVLVEAPLELTFLTQSQPMWPATEPLPTFDARVGWYANNEPSQLPNGDVPVSTPFPQGELRARMSGGYEGRIDMGAQEGDVTVLAPIETRIGYPDAIRLGTPFDLTSTLVWKDLTTSVLSTSFFYDLSLDFDRFRIHQVEACATLFASAGVVPCKPMAIDVPIDLQIRQSLVQPAERWIDQHPAQTEGFDGLSFARSAATRPYRMPWVSFLQSAMINAGLPGLYGQFDFYPWGRGYYGGYRFDYTLLVPYALVEHDIDYGFTLDLTTIPYTLTLENGTTIQGALGTATAVTLPADADANQDGRVDFTLAMRPEATWTTVESHTYDMGLELEGMRVQVTQLDNTSIPRGSFPEQIGWNSRVTATPPEQTFFEQRPLEGWNTHVLRGSFDLVP